MAGNVPFVQHTHRRPLAALRRFDDARVMAVESHRIHVATRGRTHVVDVTAEVRRALAAGRIRDGIVTVFVVGSTASLTTTEFEPGLAEHDLAAALERVAPRDGE